MRTIPERPIFELCRNDKPGFRVHTPDPELDNVELGFLEREDIGAMSQATEIDVIRHYTRLSKFNYDIDRGLYPLGSCTMKHNPRVNEAIAADPHWRDPHPLWPEEFTAGHRAIMEELAEDLAEISGFDHMSLLPAAGAHGELTAVFMIRAYHLAKGRDDKRIFLIPDSAHGTNPASAAMAGFKCKEVASGPDGYLRLEDLEPHLSDEVAAIMITNPNTLGIYEREFEKIAKAMHDHDALVYMDGANLNAFMGVFQPGRIGADVMHFNLHKTFTTPHGGGGPGSGPIGFNKALAPYAPEAEDGIGPVKAYEGQWGMFIRAWSYIRTLGGTGLREVSEEAVLNANYLRARLQDVLPLPFDTPTLHEVVFNDKDLPNDIQTGDVAKRLIDYGFHPPTVYFPIHVKGALMIEPTETETIEELDRFVAAMTAIRREADEDPERLKLAPHTTPVSRVDEVLAARSLDLRWLPSPELA
ncbi:MAG: aminomethyl-transferring glycine dehydrogenase subunit GcvPB [Planctomycetota bacterium]|nr:aminomethyl-transferring glycine dehydrogenase subunit GcvPB [Planctomycetota bacterium]